MSTSYTHFTTEERESLVRYQAAGFKQSEMARRLKRSRSSISRELRRNGEADGRYSGFASEKKYRQRRKRCVRKRLLDDPMRNKLVTEKLLEYWSPEQIAERLNASGSELRVSYSTIYRVIQEGQLEISKKCLRRKGCRASPHDEETRGRLHGHKTIHERPRAVDTRSQFGHWERDTLQGAREKGAVATFVDRRSGFLVACLLPNRKANVLAQAQCAAFAAFPPSLLRSFMGDNGNEFFDYKDVEQRLGTKQFLQLQAVRASVGLTRTRTVCSGNTFLKRLTFLLSRLAS